MYDSLALAPTSPDEEAEYTESSVENIEARPALDWIDENLFTVYAARSGTRRVHPGAADVLRNLAKDEVISLSAPGDAQNEVELPPENLNDDNRGNRRDVTHVSLQSAPAEIAYQYPLDQQLTR